MANKKLKVGKKVRRRAFFTQNNVLIDCFYVIDCDLILKFHVKRISKKFQADQKRVVTYRTYSTSFYYKLFGKAATKSILSIDFKSMFLSSNYTFHFGKLILSLKKFIFFVHFGNDNSNQNSSIRFLYIPCFRPLL